MSWTICDIGRKTCSINNSPWLRDYNCIVHMLLEVPNVIIFGYILFLSSNLRKIILQVSKQKQRTAFPPNFVHSLDSSHMMMTATACRSAGLTFAGVHDSFWTHACDVDTMNIILREKFVELYEIPILENVCFFLIQLSY